MEKIIGFLLKECPFLLRFGFSACYAYILIVSFIAWFTGEAMWGSLWVIISVVLIALLAGLVWGNKLNQFDPESALPNPMYKATAIAHVTIIIIASSPFFYGDKHTAVLILLGMGCAGLFWRGLRFVLNNMPAEQC